MEVQANWGMEEENKFYFRKNYAKYEFFKNPLVSPTTLSAKWHNFCKVVFSLTHRQAEHKAGSASQEE